MSEKTHFDYCWREPAHRFCYLTWVSKMQAAGWTSFSVPDARPGFFDAIFQDVPDGWSGWAGDNEVRITHEQAEGDWARGFVPVVIPF